MPADLEATLLAPVTFGTIACRNRIAMAPCTRCQSPGSLPGPRVADYYARRAADGVGLIVSEATVICERGNGYPNVPGIWREDQVLAWRRVTEAVHREGGRMLCQLWHTSAFAHPLTTGGFPPEGPAGVSPAGFLKQVRTESGDPVPYGATEVMSEARIEEVIEAYGQAARCALAAGFDGVELHGAHGYLIDQFLNLHWNRRQDSWGGPGRARFAVEVVRRVLAEAGPGRTCFRFSPVVSVGGPGWVDPRGTFDLLLAGLWEAGLRLLHASHQDFDEPVMPAVGAAPQPLLPLHVATRQAWRGSIIGVGGLTVARAARAIAAGEVDLVAFGRALLANPDFVSRVRRRQPLRPYALAHLLDLT